MDSNMKNKQKNTIQHQHEINTERIQIKKENWRMEDHYFKGTGKPFFDLF